MSLLALHAALYLPTLDPSHYHWPSSACRPETVQAEASAVLPSPRWNLLSLLLRGSSSWITVCIDSIWLFELVPWAFAWWLRTEILESDSLHSKLGLSNYLLCDHEEVTFSLWAPVSPSTVSIWLCVHAQSLQLCLTLCVPVDCSPPSSSVRVVFQTRTLEWVATLPSRGSSQPRDWTYHVSCKAGGFFTTEPPGKPNLVIMVPISQVLMKITWFKTIIVRLYIMIAVIKDYMSYYLSST